MSERDATPPAELGDLRAEWARRGARLLPGHVIVTAPGQNTHAFRKAVYARMGLRLPAPPPGFWGRE